MEARLISYFRGNTYMREKHSNGENGEKKRMKIIFSCQILRFPKIFSKQPFTYLQSFKF